MRFLVDADLPRGTAPLIRAFVMEAVDVRDIGMASAEDVDIAARAKSNGYCLVTGDFGFADIRNYPPADYHGIVVLELPRDATARFILGLVEGLMRQPALLARLSGRLAILAAGRIRLRPA
jgi:hypothetical protein